MKFLSRYIFVPVLIIVFFIVFYSVYHEVKNKTIAQFNAEQLLIAKSASQGIKDYLGNLQSDLSFLSTFPELVDFNENGKELSRKFYTNHSAQIEAITRISPEGLIMFTYPENKDVLGMDISYQKHFSEVQKVQKPVVSDVFVSVQGYLAIAIHVPVFKNNEFEGSLAVLLAIDKIGKRYLEKVKKGESGYAFLLSENNIEIFCPFNEHISKSILDISKNDVSVLNLLDSIKNNNFGTVNSYHGPSGEFKKTETNINFYRIPLGNTYWTILIANPRAEAVNTITGFRNRLLVFFIVFLAVILIYFYFFEKARKVLEEENKRKHAEKALFASEKRYQILFENSIDAILLASPDGSIIEANPAACAMFGRTEKEICDAGRNGLIDKNDPKIKTLLSEREKNGRVSGELNMVRKDGSVFQAELSSAIFNNLEGNSRTSIIIRDISNRKTIEEALLLSERQNRIVFEHMLEAMAYHQIVFEDGKAVDYIYLRVNNAFTSHTGLKDVLGKKVSEIIPGIHKNNPELMEHFGRVAKTGIPEQYETFIKDTNTWFFTSLYSFEKGVVVSVFNNITEQKQAEKELLESKSFFEQLFLQSSTSTQLLDKDGWCIKINPKLSELFGVLPEHIEGKKYNILKDDEIIKTGVINHLKKVYNKKELVQWEVNFDIKHASESTGVRVSKPERRWFQNTSYPILDGNGELIYVIVQHNDITNRKLAEVELKNAEKRERLILLKSEKRYRTLFENINAGFVLFEVVQDKKGIPVDLIIVASNKLFEKTTKLKNKEVVGKRLTKVLPGIEKDKANWIGTYGKIALTGKAKQFEQGSELLGYYYSVMAFRAEPKQCAVTFLDITENKLAEEEIKKLNKELEKRVAERTQELSNSQLALLNMVEDLHNKSVELEQSSEKLKNKNKELETFTYSVSHDLKAPLRGIDGYSRLLQEYYSDQLKDEGKKFIETIREGTKQMNQLIEDLLAYSRLERSAIKTSHINIKESINTVLGFLKNEIKSKNISITLDVDECVVDTDYDALTIALRNLIENAIKFSDKADSPQINIILEENVSWVQLCIEDNGIGFNMKYHDRIFEIFQRLNLPEHYKGTGIGLALVAKSMERINGKVWAESAPGKGAKFYIKIPKKINHEHKKQKPPDFTD